MFEHSYQRILLVEDDSDDVKMTLTALQDYNLANEVVVVSDSEEAICYLGRKGKFSLRAPGNPIIIILDVKFSTSNGLDVLKQIRADESFKLIPVVFLSSSKKYVDLFLNGVNSYVLKPLDFHEFVNAVRKLGIFWAMVNSE